MRRGEIRWYTYRAPDKRRPVLVMSRDDVLDVVNEIIVVPATRTIRGISTEIVLTSDDGLPVACALNFDHISLGQRSKFGATLAVLAPARWPEVERALLTACGFGPPAR